jgi:hypothetical protein
MSVDEAYFCSTTKEEKEHWVCCLLFYSFGSHLILMLRICFCNCVQHLLPRLILKSVSSFFQIFNAKVW